MSEAPDFMQEPLADTVSASEIWEETMPKQQLRMQPHELLAEQSVLGAMLQSKDAAAELAAKLHPRDFYVPKHEVIFEALVSLTTSGDPADIVTLVNYLKTTGNIQRAGGVDYLHELLDVTPTATNADFYARIVQDKAVLRRLIAVGTNIAEMGFAEGGRPEALVNRAQAEVYALSDFEEKSTMVQLNQALDQAIEQIEYANENPEGAMGVPTGFASLDEKTNGFKGGQLIIIAARPGMGKSTMALDVARATAIGANIPTVFFSLEMGSTEIATRLIAAEAEIDMANLQKGQIADDQWVQLAQTRARVDQAQLFIDDSPNMTLAEIRAKCRRMKNANNLGVIVIDYLQLLSSTGKVESRQQEVSEFSRSLKLLAKELDVPVIALSQLNRSAEQRADKKPHMSDLRESGSIEQDADKIILLHRDLAAKFGEPGFGEAQFLLVKQRNGPTGEIDVAFQGQYSRFRDLAV